MNETDSRTLLEELADDYNNMTRPRQSLFRTTFFYKAGAVVAKKVNGAFVEDVPYGANLSSCPQETIDNVEDFKAALKSYDKRTTEISEQWYKTLAVHLCGRDIEAIKTVAELGDMTSICMDSVDKFEKFFEMFDAYSQMAGLGDYAPR